MVKRKRAFRKGDKVRLARELAGRRAFRRALADRGGPDVRDVGEVVAAPQGGHVSVRFPSGHLMVCDPDNLRPA